MYGWQFSNHSLFTQVLCSFCSPGSISFANLLEAYVCMYAAIGPRTIYIFKLLILVNLLEADICMYAAIGPETIYIFINS